MNETPDQPHSSYSSLGLIDKVLLCTLGNYEVENYLIDSTKDTRFKELTKQEGDIVEFYFSKFTLELKMTAGQILPDNIGKVRFNGDDYFRRGLTGEFYNEKGKILQVFTGTKIQIFPRTDTEKEKIKQEISTEYLKWHKAYSNSKFKQAIAYYAIEKGVDVTIAIKELYEKLGGENREKEFSTDGKYITMPKQIYAKLENKFAFLEKTNFSKQRKLQKTNTSELPQKERTEPYATSGEGLLENPYFMSRLKEVATKTGANANDLVKVMMTESKLNPTARNPKTGAIGLIQFLPDTAMSLGTTSEKIAKMSAIEQLDLVEEFFKTNSRGVKLNTLEKLYKAVFYPLALEKPEDFIFGSQIGMDNAIALARRNPLITKHSKKRVHKAGKDYPVIDQFAFSKFVNEHVKNIV